MEIQSSKQSGWPEAPHMSSQTEQPSPSFEKVHYREMSKNSAPDLEKEKKDMEEQNPSNLRSISFPDLQKSLELLADNASVNIDSLNKDSEIYKAYEYILLSISIFSETTFTPFLKMVDNLPRPIKIVPQTCGAFLFGDYYNCYGDDFTMCSPMSIASLPRGEKGSDWSTKSGSTDQIWLIKNGKVASFRATNSAKASIYIDYTSYEDFPGLTEDEIQEMIIQGVEEARFVLTTGGDKQTILKDYQPLESIKRRNDDVSADSEERTEDSGSRNRDGDSSDSNDYWWIILIVIAVIAVLVVIILFSYGGSSSRYMRDRERYGVNY